MPSPFPGMDPWLERRGLFPDFHDSLIYLMRETLNALMPPGYAAMGTTLVWTEPDQRRQPDVAVTGRAPRPGDHSSGVAVALPGLKPAGAARQPARVVAEQKYLEIRATQDRRLVTAIEVISPANKRPGPGRRAFRVKQAELRRRGVHTVEVDLLRAGQYVSAAPRERIAAIQAAFDYHVCVTVAERPARFHAAAWRLADPLPAFGVPLDPGVPPPVVTLKPLLDRAYDTGRYSQLVDYDHPCDPPLTPEQQVWANGILNPGAT